MRGSEDKSLQATVPPVAQRISPNSPLERATTQRPVSLQKKTPATLRRPGQMQDLNYFLLTDAVAAVLLPAASVATALML